MKRSLRNALLAAGLALASAPVAQASYGFFANGGSFVVLSLNGGTSAYYHLSPNANAAPFYHVGSSGFAGTNFGKLWKGFNTLVLKGFENNTFSNGGDDVISGSLLYRVVEQGQTPGAFSLLNFTNNSVLGGGDERHETSTASISLFTSNLHVGKNYLVQIAPQATVDWNTPNGSPDDTFWVDNNGNPILLSGSGSPYIFQGQFTAAGVPEPTTGVLLGASLLVGIRVMRRKAKPVA
jgi:hypothetical protein